MKRKDEEPAWVARFLAALQAEPKVRAAARAAEVALATAYHRRRTNEAFRREWDALRGKTAGDEAEGWGGTRKIAMKRIDRFLEHLAENSNIRAAADAAGVDPRAVYRLRRADPDFARRWYAALAEGYDNLEMEMLEHLRSSGESGEAGAGKGGRKFDTATALRCLTAHRESVAREKGRRTLADEVTTIAAINAKIDALRARARKGDAAIRKARRNAASKPTDDKG